MSCTRWTEEQEKAIATRGRCLLVSAAAGAGKTAVLVERITRRLLDKTAPVDLDRLLVVTFTEAAAGEMRHRVRNALVAALQQGEDNALARRQLFLMPRAAIGTLHSFCSQVVRRHFYLLSLDPGLRVMDEQEASLFRREVAEEVLEELYEEHRDAPPDAPFLCLASFLADRHGDDRELIAVALRLYDFARSLPRPRAWLNRLVALLTEAGGRSWAEQPWHSEWQEMIRLELEYLRDDLAVARELAAAPGGPKSYVSVLEEDLERVRSWCELVGESCAELPQALQEGQSWPVLPRVGKGEAAEECKERVQKLRNGAKERLKKLLAEHFSRPAGEVLADLSRTAPLVQALVAVVRRFDKRYRQAKQERSVVDFADLEHYALAILANNAEGSPWGIEAPADPAAPLLPSPVAFEYRQFFTEVLVDEYQDVNGVQEALLELVARENNRFFVGDVKQSIYRFRLADPTVFLSRYEQFQDPGPAAGPGPGWRLTLSANFRSRREILETANFLFERLMTRRVGELDYDQRARLLAAADYPEPAAGKAGGPVEVHLLDFPAPAAGGGEMGGGEEGSREPGGGEPEPDELDLVRLEARWVAERVYRLVTAEDFQVYEKEQKKYRPVTWRDVVVLLRSLKGRVAVFLEEFRRLGVPVYADSPGGYFEAPEVQAVLSLLRIIDNPRQDIPLAAVLRSPVVGLSAARLAEIRLACPGGDFYTAVNQAARGVTGVSTGVSPELAGQLRQFLEQLDRWRELARRLPPAELLEELYRRTGYYDLVGAMPGGAVRQANLRALVDRARRFEGTIYRGLFRFLRFLEQLQDEGGDLDTARTLSENEDVVRIMSIHRAKGLEFPVVVVAGLGHRFNLQDLSGDFLFHRQLGCGPVVVDLERGICSPTVLHRLIRHRLRLETIAEEMRLFYVALTRAKERLILTAAVRELARRVNNWRSQAAVAAPAGPLGVSLTARASSFLDWLGPALWSHPALGGFSLSEEMTAAGSECWRVHLWPAEVLRGLGRVDEAALQESQDFSWLRQLVELTPLPEEWLGRQEENWPGGAAELVPGAELRHRLFWSCPYRELAGLPSKVTVTGWRHRQEELAEGGGEEEIPGERWLPEETGEVSSPALPAVRKGFGEVVTRESSGSEKQREKGTAGEGKETPEDESFLEMTSAGGLPPGFALPAFYLGERPGGVERGRVIHLVMQNLELNPPLDAAGVAEQLASLVRREILRSEERQLVDPAEIARFWQTALGRRVLAAAREGRLWREVPFTLGLAVPELYPELAGKVPEEESILLQGVIDCLLEEGEGLVIIDYKTDRLTGDRLVEAVQHYTRQLDLYARAAEKLLHRPVREKYLYFFSLRQAVMVWRDSAGNVLFETANIYERVLPEYSWSTRSS